MTLQKQLSILSGCHTADFIYAQQKRFEKYQQWSKICLKLTIKRPERQVSSLVTLNRFNTLFYCLHYWL